MFGSTLSRRGLLGGLACLPWSPLSAQELQGLELREVELKLSSDPAPATRLWSAGGTIPGQILRARAGGQIALRVTNRLPQTTSFHWQGLRLPNEMDKVQIGPGQSAQLRFTTPDAGTYWYRPALWPQAAEQKARGLYGLLIVEGRSEPQVDRDMTVVLDDWHLDEAGQIKADFTNQTDVTGPGRIGPLLTVNSKPVPQTITGRPGARVRLRILNACSARLIGLLIEGLRAIVVSIDGQSCEPFEPARDRLPLGPGARFDLILDLPPEGTPATLSARGAGLRREETSEPNQPLLILKGQGSPVSPREPVRSGQNPDLPEQLRLQTARRMELTIAPTGSEEPGRYWGFNGMAGTGTDTPALFKVEPNRVVTLAFINRSPLAHSIHVQGHPMRVLHQLDDGWEPYWRDAVIIPPGRTVRTAFLANNPGRWLIESTILTHGANGLVGWYEVG